jgi:hypothetical protein
LLSSNEIDTLTISSQNLQFPAAAVSITMESWRLRQETSGCNVKRDEPIAVNIRSNWT